MEHDYESRIRLRNYVKKELFEINGEIIEEKYLFDIQDKLELGVRITNDDTNCKFSDVYKMYIQGDNETAMALKCVPVNYEDENDDRWSEYRVYIEAKVLRLTNRFLEAGMTQNFLFHYGSLLGIKHKFHNKYMRTVPSTCVGFLNELANGDMEDWMLKTRTRSAWRGLIGQLLCTLSLMQLSSCLVHRDVHAGNLLFNKVKKGGYWKYSFKHSSGKSINISVENTGHIWKLWDFGNSYVEKMSKSLQEKMLEDFTRFHRIHIVRKSSTTEIRKGMKGCSLSKQEKDDLQKAIDTAENAMYDDPHCTIKSPALIILRELQQMGWFKRPLKSECKKVFVTSF